MVLPEMLIDNVYNLISKDGRQELELFLSRWSFCMDRNGGKIPELALFLNKRSQTLTKNCSLQYMFMGP